MVEKLLIPGHNKLIALNNCNNGFANLILSND
jgi:hypothetical protein